MIKHPYRPAGVIALAVEAKKEINRGDIVALTAGGLAVPVTDANATTIVGRADNRADNSGGSAGDVRVDVLRNRAFLFQNGTGADEVKLINLFESCYLVDDSTVSPDSDGENRLTVGKIIEISNEGVWVQIG